MKKIIVILLFAITFNGLAQTKGIFSKDPIINLENFQKQKLYFGFYLGFNSYDFKVVYKTPVPDIAIKKSTGFNVGLVADLKLQEYIDLRFEPGLYYTTRDFYYPTSYFTNPTATYPNSSDKLREVNSTYIHFPLLLKFSSARTGNIRPYLLGGASATLNLSSNAKSVDDNLEQRFRVKPWTTNYEMGFGIDIFSEYFIFSPSIRGVFGINDELIRDKDPASPWTSNIQSLKSRAVFINFTFH
ncbi:outer membrane beta-barrel protein [Flavobacterium sp.]|uniref:type IX secretion/gliding motility protein PorT/SprT n=1 Tax=Flavobacterium sp. TaxID=239 RepID=UPI0037A3396B